MAIQNIISYKTYAPVNAPSSTNTIKSDLVISGAEDKLYSVTSALRNQIYTSTSATKNAVADQIYRISQSTKTALQDSIYKMIKNLTYTAPPKANIPPSIGSSTLRDSTLTQSNQTTVTYYEETEVPPVQFPQA